MFRTTHIRTKLAVALAIPLAALVAVAGFEVVTASQQVEEVGEQTDLATSALGPGSFVVSLQDERNRASIDLIGLAAELTVDTNEEARGLTDASLAELRDRLSGQPDLVASAFEPAFTALEDLEGLRADIDAYDGPMDISNDEFADEVFVRYTDIVESFFDATSTIALSVDEADLRNGVEIVDAATRQSEMRARIVRRVVLAAVSNALDSPEALQEIAALRDRGLGYDSDIAVNSVGPFAGVGAETFEEENVQSFNAQVDAFLAGEVPVIVDMLGAVSSADPTLGYLGLRERAGSLLQAEAESIEDDAVARQRTFIAVAAGALLLAALVTWLASRSITRPLRSLKSQAEVMAGTALPAAVRQILETPPGDDVVIPEMEPIKVKSRDEVAEVAGALSAVQTSALDLAVEQAVLRRNISDSYINLGRRNQNLLSRQLDFITELERNESDPEALEGLFRLDHLATRMRRNAESLLVLAGIEPPRQWSAPVKVGDVVRAALGEVEDYQRVVARHLEPAAVAGSAATDIAHILAELLENALSFSPPEQTVEIKGRFTPAGYTLAVSDNGLGMRADDIARANRRLAGQESFTVAPSRYLGHYVAGHLASRLGITVELQDSPAGGITARIDLPTSVLADEGADQRASAPAATPAASSTAASAGDAEVELDIDAASTAARPEPSRTESGLPRRDRSAPSVPAAPPAPPAPPAPAHAARPATPASIPPPPPAPVAADPVERASVPEPVASAPATADAAVDAGDDAVGPDDDGVTRDAPFVGLAVAQPVGSSMFTVAAERARLEAEEAEAASAERAGPDGEPAAAPAPSAGGLSRRVPGAQRPDVPLGAPSDRGGAVEAETRTSPEDVYAFLSNFQSGVKRGQAEAHGADSESGGEER